MLNKNLIKVTLIISLVVVLVISGCTSDLGSDSEVVIESTSKPIELDENLPDNDMDPDYDYVFNDSNVMEFYIEIDSDQWDLMQEDLKSKVTSNKNDKKDNKRDKQAKPGEAVVQDTEVSPGDSPVQNIVADDTSDEPIWVESTITVDDVTYNHVGIRYKGNSSLNSAVSSGNGKLSLKLDFDEFEDDYPEIDDQRFYGFKQLNLNNNFSDTSLMHDKVAADLFNEFGVPAADTRFAVVYLDHGNGSEYYGVYALIEEIDDTGIESLFDDSSGNLYKPDGSAASFSAGSFDESQMEKKSNEEESDYSDVKALYDVINSDLRQSDIDAWKSDLENIFNVDGFLKYLAANNIIQNWDTYGTMTHNFYLYNDPDTGLLNWIVWDNNEAFSEGKGNRGAMSLSTDEVSADWPLVSYLMDVEEYVDIYEEYLQAFIDDVYTEDKMNDLYDTYYDLIKDYAYAEVDGFSFISSDSQFDQGVDALRKHVVSRRNVVESYLK